MADTLPESSTTPARVQEDAEYSTLFGPPPLLLGESAAHWHELHAKVMGALKPTDILEKILAWDIVNLIWEDMRWRRLIPSLLTATAHQGLEKILDPLLDPFQARTSARLWALGEESAINDVDEVLASADLTMDAVMAQTLAINLNAIVRIDELSASAQARLKFTLREFERRRAMSGRYLTQEEPPLIEAEAAKTSPAA
jgi:hypothetical protein